jgi:hypothetical protein
MVASALWHQQLQVCLITKLLRFVYSFAADQWASVATKAATQRKRAQICRCYLQVIMQFAAPSDCLHNFA